MQQHSLSVKLSSTVIGFCFLAFHSGKNNGCIMRANKNGGGQVTVVLDNLGNQLRDIKVYSQEKQTGKSGFRNKPLSD